MNKILAKDFRKTKELTLPVSGLTLTCYSSLLVSDVKAEDITETLDGGLKVLAKIIKAWNFYESETDEKPVEIGFENLRRLPATDLEWLSEQIKNWVADLKKSQNLRIHSL